MLVLVIVETIALALMALLVAGLLRSHAEILRRLEAVAPAAPAAVSGRRQSPGTDLPPARDIVTPAFDIVGTTLDGDAVKLTMATGRPGGTVLAFLSSGCLSCRSFWDELRDGAADSLPGSPRVVVVTKDSTDESPSKLRELASEKGSPVMSTRAWEDYRIAGSPYFVHVDPAGGVLGEGTAGTWGQVASLLRDAADDAAVAARSGGRSTGPAERLRRADDELASAGIGPGHPSLYGAAGPPYGEAPPDPSAAATGT
jgi:hypothetical protein